MRSLVTVPNDVLKQKCHEVTDFDRELKKLAKDMTRVMRISKGVGLAAPQVGDLRRIFVLGLTGGQPLVCVNPVIEERDETLSRVHEGCLSIPGLRRWIARPKRVVMRFRDLSGRELTATFRDFASHAAQHEYDHLDGILITDHPETPHESSRSNTLENTARVT